MALLDIDLIKGRIYVSGHFTLTERIPNSEYHAERFWSSEVLYSGESEVHRGTMKVSPNLAVEGVCKLARGDLSRLKHEAKLYADPNHLLPLQGSVVPRFLGYYECEFEWEGRDVLLGCMLLEYCGVSVPSKLLYEKYMKGKIIDAMAAIHSKAHLEHGDFGFDCRHAVMRGSEEGGDLDVRIVDFNEAFEHTCERKMPIEMWAWEPHVAAFGCQELWNVVWSLGVWTPILIHLLGDYYHIFRVATVKRLVKWAMYNNKILAKEYIVPRARAALAAYYEQYSERFARIGDPRLNMLPLLIPGELTDATDTSLPTPHPVHDSD